MYTFIISYHIALRLRYEGHQFTYLNVFTTGQTFFVQRNFNFQSHYKITIRVACSQIVHNFSSIVQSVVFIICSTVTAYHNTKLMKCYATKTFQLF